MDVSENSGTPKSSIFIGFSIVNHPFWGIPIFGNTHIYPIENGRMGPTLKSDIRLLKGHVSSSNHQSLGDIFLVFKG